MNNQYGNHSMTDYQIHLNFLPVQEPLPTLTVFRKPSIASESRPFPEINRYNLPSIPADEDSWQSYWISVTRQDGYEQYETEMLTNPYLTCRILYHALRTAAEQQLKSEQFSIPKNPFISEVSFIQRIHNEGNEQLEVKPYYLRSTRQFGYLVNFHFCLAKDVAFSRKIQQLSLSLNSSFKRNLDYYVDRDSKLKTFLKEREDVFSALKIPETNERLCLDSDFVSLQADRLQKKTYIFEGNRDSRSQFTGLRGHYGPLKPLDTSPRLLFIFREQDRNAARLLAKGLRGSGQRVRYAFPSFNALFKSDLEIDSNPCVLPDLGQTAMEYALNYVKTNLKEYPNTLPVMILPSQEDDKESYLTHKALFTQAEISTQVCTLPTLQDEESLKWAIANIALQIFCKAGGYPWKVKPVDTKHTLIVGISQSHKLRTVDDQTKVEKYFAFSVLTDSSGLFQEIQVLGESSNETDYLAKLRESLREVLNQSAEKFRRVVVHTSFKLKHHEIDAIQKTVKDFADSTEFSGCEFAIVKINHKSRFFGTNRGVNSLVPFEATRVYLGPGEYLVWFEGIFPDRTTVNKAFPAPTHLQVLRVSDKQSIPHEHLLQDLVNLSGANWRGFNAKSAPISIFYCHLVADMVHNFHERLTLPLSRADEEH